MGVGERRLAAGNLPTFPASEAAVSFRMAPAPSRAGDLLTSPVPSVIVYKTTPPGRAPAPETLCTTGPMAITRRAATTAPRRTVVATQRTVLSSC